MHHTLRSLLPLAMVFIAATLVGCMGGPAAVDVPQIQPEEAARGALETYDRDDDGHLSIEELEACPAMRDAIRSYDKDGDRKISQDELSNRFAMWVKGGVAVTTLTCNVTFKGRPLAGAQIELVPESFFAGAIQPATGVTDQTGIAILGIDPEYLPDDMKDLQGLVHQGVFRVKITHPEINVPARYNSETTLGFEVSADTGKNSVRWDLTGK